MNVYWFDMTCEWSKKTWPRSIHLIAFPCCVQWVIYISRFFLSFWWNFRKKQALIHSQINQLVFFNEDFMTPVQNWLNLFLLNVWHSLIKTCMQNICLRLWSVFYKFFNMNHEYSFVLHGISRSEWYLMKINISKFKNLAHKKVFKAVDTNLASRRSSMSRKETLCSFFCGSLN